MPQHFDMDLWYWRLDPEADRLARLSDHLSPDETARAARFLRPGLGDAYRAGRRRMREILGAYLGLPPGSLSFEYNPEGKPSLAGGPAFNLSHSGGWAALAVAESGTLGIDIEAWREVERGVAERFFSDTEVASISPLSGSVWQAAFFRCWTRKEAVVKACGPGLSMPLGDFDVTLLADEAAAMTRLAGGDPDRWTLVDLDPGPALSGALAVLADGRAVRVTVKEARPPLEVR